MVDLQGHVDGHADWEVENWFETLLDEVHGDVEVCGQDFSSGVAYRRLDPTGFRVSAFDHLDGWVSEGGDCPMCDWVGREEGEEGEEG